LINADGVKGQWVSLHQSDSQLTPEYVKLRDGQMAYGFSKLRARANKQAVRHTRYHKVHYQAFQRGQFYVEGLVPTRGLTGAHDAGRRRYRATG
jgi:hypothetical protein